MFRFDICFLHFMQADIAKNIQIAEYCFIEQRVSDNRDWLNLSTLCNVLSDKTLYKFILCVVWGVIIKDVFFNCQWLKIRIARNTCKIMLFFFLLVWKTFSHFSFHGNQKISVTPLKDKNLSGVKKWCSIFSKLEVKWIVYFWCLSLKYRQKR